MLYPPEELTLCPWRAPCSTCLAEPLTCRAARRCAKCREPDDSVPTDRPAAETCGVPELLGSGLASGSWLVSSRMASPDSLHSTWWLQALFLKGVPRSCGCGMAQQTRLGCVGTSAAAGTPWRCVPSLALVVAAGCNAAAAAAAPGVSLLSLAVMEASRRAAAAACKSALLLCTAAAACSSLCWLANWALWSAPCWRSDPRGLSAHTMLRLPGAFVLSAPSSTPGRLLNALRGMAVMWLGTSVACKYGGPPGLQLTALHLLDSCMQHGLVTSL